MIVCEVAPSYLSVDVSEADGAEPGTILAHRIKAIARMSRPPTVQIDLSAGDARVVRGRKDVLAARAVGRPFVHAIVLGNPEPAAIDSFLRRVGGRQVDWRALRDSDERATIERGWHSFYFARPLAIAEKEAFNETMRVLFGAAIDVVHDDLGPSAEFEADTPVNDHGWAQRFVAAISALRRARVEIVTENGLRVGDAAAG